MPNLPNELVFDTGPLSHFALSGWLSILRSVVGTRKAVIPETVLFELKSSVHQHSHLRPILDATWIEHKELKTSGELAAFAKFSSLLVADDRNVGEAGVLAYAMANGATAIIDDGPGRKAAQTHNVPCRGTLGLLCESVCEGLLTAELVSDVADHLIETQYRLPFGAGGFIAWAHDKGLLTPKTALECMENPKSDSPHSLTSPFNRTPPNRAHGSGQPI